MLRKSHLLICLISFSLLSHVRCDYYLSVTGLQNLLAVESYWVTNVENYMKGVEESNNSLRKYLRSIADIFKEFFDEPTELYEDPLNAFTSIKRIVSDWKIKERSVVNSKDVKDFAKNLAQIQTKLKIALPTLDDLSDAAKSMARLQKTYALKTEDVANGKLLNTTYSSSMTAKECFYLGRNLYDAQLSELAVEWLLEARARNKELSNATGFEALLEVEDIALLEILGPAFFKSGNFKMAVKINEELLHKQPESENGLLNKPLFENKLLEEREIRLLTDGSSTDPRAHSKVEELDMSNYSDVRSSKNSWLWLSQHSFLNVVSQRLADISGLSLESAEPLQVATYGMGGHYEPHHDFSEEPNPFDGNGNRIATALFYISEVELGGGTAFPHLRLVVPPVRGSLVLWYNLHESLELDYRTLHAGCPVLKGSKWVCNEWFHETKQEFTRPCGLQLQANKSIKYKHLNYLS